MPAPDLQRRHLLIAATLGTGAWLVGCADASRQQPRAGGLPLQDGQLALNGWIKVDRAGVVTVVMSKAEIGQGTHTGVMMLAAEELDAGEGQWRREGAPVDPLYGNVAAMAEGLPFRPDDEGLLARSARWVMLPLARQLGIMMTGGSSSLRDLWLPMREAAAITRATLIEAAARHWGVVPDGLRLRAGRIEGAAGRSMPLGDAVGLLGHLPQPASHYTLTARADWRLIGTEQPRIDARDKVQGRAVYGIDVRPPGLLHAALRLAPDRGGAVQSVRDAAARASRGVQGVVVLPPLNGGSGGVAVVADRHWRALRALDTLEVSWSPGPLKGWDNQRLQAALSQALDGDDGHVYWSQGDAAARLRSPLPGQTVVRAEYAAPWLAHAALEPMNCTVQMQGDRATVWVPTQVPGMARQAAAQALGLDDARVDVITTDAGGGFGRRLEVDVVAQAATVARAFPGRPVQLLWSREDDTRHDFYRPGCVARLQAVVDAQGLRAWVHRSASQAITPGYLRRTTGMGSLGPDKTTAEGAFDQAYALPEVEVSHATVELPLPVGFWRSVGHSHQAFFQESFIDECAHAAGLDPLALRLSLLAGQPRHTAVLRRAAEAARWSDTPPPAADGARTAWGLAIHASFGSIVAQAALVSLDARRQLRVHRVVCAIDCGVAINPLLIRQQVEGSVAWALGAALHERIDIDDGRVRQAHFADLARLRMADAPEVEVHIVPSGDEPRGVGEPAVPPLAPAVANALFRLTGQRLRQMPLQPGIPA